MTIETNNEAEEEFLKACCQHDLTYAYSDDHRYWVAGVASLRLVTDMRSKIGIARSAEIWNAVVDTKMLEPAREQFYWK